MKKIKNIIEIKEDVKIGNIILEKGDKIKILKTDNKLLETSYEDFLMNYGSELKDAVRSLQNLKPLMDNVSDDDWTKIERNMQVYDASVGQAIQQWIYSNVTARDIAQYAIEQMNRTGTEPKQVLNAINDFVSYVQRYAR